MNWTAAKNRVAVIVLAASAVFVLAVILAVLLVAGPSGATVLEWLTTTPPCEGPCD